MLPLPPAIELLKANEQLTTTTQPRQVKYLNNQVKQDQAMILRRTKLRIGFGCFQCAPPTLRALEAMNLIGQGQVQAVDTGVVRSHNACSCLKFSQLLLNQV